MVFIFTESEDKPLNFDGFFIAEKENEKKLTERMEKDKKQPKPG